MKTSIDKAAELVKEYGSHPNFVADMVMEMFNLLKEIVSEYDEHALDEETNKFFVTRCGVASQIVMHNILNTYTSASLTMIPVSNRKKLAVFKDYDSMEGAGIVELVSAEGTQRRLMELDLFMAVLEGRLSDSAREFFDSNFGAEFNQRGEVDFEQLDQTWSGFWFAIRDLGHKSEYDKNCFVDC